MQVACSFFERLRGVMFLPDFVPTFFPDCSAVHTCWVFQRIHLVWVSREGVVLKVQKHVWPFGIYWCSGACGVVEYQGKEDIPHQVGDKILLPKNLEKYSKGYASDSGQALVEFALILPVLFLLIFGFLYLSLGISELQRLQYVVNSATTTGAMTNDDLKISGVIEDFYPLGEVALTIENKDDESGAILLSSDRQYNDILTVQLQYDFPITIPYVEVASVPLRVVATSRILCQESNPPYRCE